LLLNYAFKVCVDTSRAWLISTIVYLIVMLILNYVSVIEPGVIARIMRVSDETGLSHYVVRDIVWQLLDNSFRPNDVGDVVKQVIN